MENNKCTLYQAAVVLRSKNSGPFSITLDVLFDDQEIYYNIKSRNVITKDIISKLYGLPISDVSDIVYFDSALGIKVTVARQISSGSPLDTDVYGCQQHAPLMNIVI